MMMKEAFVKNQKRRIGILTSGDCPGLNAVIRASVLSSERLEYSSVFCVDMKGLVIRLRTCR